MALNPSSELISPRQNSLKKIQNNRIRKASKIARKFPQPQKMQKMNLNLPMNMKLIY